MIPYLVAYLFYFAILATTLDGRHLRVGFFVASIPLFFLVFFRGLVGVDIPMYEKSIDLIRISQTYTFTFEPFFEYIALALADNIDDSSLVLLVFSALTTVILYIAIFRLEKKPYLFSFCVVPYFYLDMTMNGIRYGLAFAIIVLSANFLVNGKKKLFFFLVFVAALIQISSILLALLLFGLIEVRWRAIFFALTCTMFPLIFFNEYLLGKLDSNMDLATESALAGLAPLLLSGAILVAFWFDRDFKRLAKMQLIILGVISFIAYLITQYFYVGLRFQQLNLFLIFVLIASIIKLKNIKVSKKTILIVFLIGIISAGFRLKNFYTEAGQGEAPFAPYQFYWER